MISRKVEFKLKFAVREVSCKGGFLEMASKLKLDHEQIRAGLELCEQTYGSDSDGYYLDSVVTGPATFIVTLDNEPLIVFRGEVLNEEIHELTLRDFVQWRSVKHPYLPDGAAKLTEATWKRGGAPAESFLRYLD